VDGRVLIAGGVVSPTAATPSAELYDPNSASFEQTGVPWSVVNALAVDSTTNPSTVYAAVFQGIISSQQGFGPNSALNFADFAGGGGFTSLALDSSTTPAKLYAGDQNGELLSSTDTGNHVLAQNILGFQPGPVLAIAAPSNAPGTVYAAGFEEFDATVAKLAPDFSSLLFSSFLGGSNGDFGNGIAVAPSGNAYVVGGTASPDFPGAAGELEGRDNPFVAKLPNTLAGSGQTDCISLGTCITFPTVVSGGNTVATTSAVGPQLPPGLSLVSNSGFTNVITTATVVASDSFPITVCFAYDPAQVTNPANLSLMHFEVSEWINVTTRSIRWLMSFAAVLPRCRRSRSLLASRSR